MNKITSNMGQVDAFCKFTQGQYTSHKFSPILIYFAYTPIIWRFRFVFFRNLSDYLDYRLPINMK